MTRFRAESPGYGASEDVMKYSPRCHTLTVRTSSSTFLVRELVDLASVSSKLTQRALPIHTYVWDRLSIVTRNLLMQCGGSISDADLKAALVEDFNTIICGQLIYDYRRVNGVNVEHDTLQLLEPGSDTRWQNRVLLEDAYPGEISRNPYRDEPLAGYITRSPDRQHLEVIVDPAFTYVVRGTRVSCKIWIPPPEQYAVAVDRRKFLDMLMSSLADGYLPAFDDGSRIPKFITEDALYLDGVADMIKGIASFNHEEPGRLWGSAEIVSSTQVDLEDLPLTDLEKSEILTGLI
jgi:hypothetical protein